MPFGRRKNNGIESYSFRFDGSDDERPGKAKVRWSSSDISPPSDYFLLLDERLSLIVPTRDARGGNPDYDSLIPVRK